MVPRGERSIRASCPRCGAMRMRWSVTAVWRKTFLAKLYWRCYEILTNSIPINAGSMLGCEVLWPTRWPITSDMWLVNERCWSRYTSIRRPNRICPSRSRSRKNANTYCGSLTAYLKRSECRSSGNTWTGFPFVKSPTVWVSPKNRPKRCYFALDGSSGDYINPIKLPAISLANKGSPIKASRG